MEIDHVSFSSSGGAGLVARTLAETQEQLGHDSKLISFYSKNLHEEPLHRPFLTLAAYADENIVKAPSTKTMVSLFRSNFQLLKPWSLREDAVLNIHWNQGVISNSSVAALLEQNKPIVWTLHDMAPFTAVCHHSHGCRQYVAECRSCPEVRAAFQLKTAKNLQDKAVFEKHQKSLCIVTPSRWMAKAAQESAVFQNQRIEVVQNPINSAFFADYSKSLARQTLKIPANALVGAALATQLDDPGKRVASVVEQFFATAKKLEKPARFLVFGNGGKALAAKYPKVIDLGLVAIEEIPKHLVAADLVCSLSIAESAGMTVREAGALGIPSVAFSNMGAIEQIDHLEDGVLLEDADDFAIALEALIEGEQGFVRLGLQAKRRSIRESKPETVATKYLDLYSCLK